MNANNIYIGNRYVPLHMGEWDANIQYEQLSAVRYQGSAYVSMKPVPAGITPLDVTYWAFWGSGNAVIDGVVIRVNNLTNRVEILEADMTTAKQDIINNTDQLAQAINQITLLQGEVSDNAAAIADNKTAIDGHTQDIASLNTNLSLKEDKASKNAGSGYMGLSGGYAQRPNLYASPLILTANITTAQTLAATDEMVQYNNIIHATQVGLTETIQIQPSGVNKGAFYITGSAAAYYDVWVSAAVLCVPIGGAGIKDIYIAVGSEKRFATEAYVPTGASRISIQIPEVYLGPIAPSQQFSIWCTNWRTGDIIGQGSIIGDNFGSTWVSVKAYRRYLPV